MPPEKWFAYLAFGHEQEVAFPCDDDRVELLKVEWIRERLFRIQQVPLLANGVSLYDLGEAEWREADVRPWFKRVAEESGLRTVRAFLTDLEREAAVRHFAKVNTASRGRYRYENAVLAFTIEEPALDAIAKEWLSDTSPAMVTNRVDRMSPSRYSARADKRYGDFGCRYSAPTPNDQ